MFSFALLTCLMLAEPPAPAATQPALTGALSPEHAEVIKLRAENTKLRKELARLQADNDDLRQQLKALRKPAEPAKKPTGDEEAKARPALGWGDFPGTPTTVNGRKFFAQGVVVNVKPVDERAKMFRVTIKASDRNLDSAAFEVSRERAMRLGRGQPVSVLAVVVGVREWTEGWTDPNGFRAPTAAWEISLRDAETEVP